MQRLSRSALSPIAFIASLWLITACGSVNPEEANKAAERLLTRAAEATQEAEATQTASRANKPSSAANLVYQPAVTPTSTPLPPTPTPDLPPIYARCIIRSPTVMRLLPEAQAMPVAELAQGEVITVYGRTRNRQWVLGWNRDARFGWVPSAKAQIGCSVPVVELKPAEPNVLVKAIATPTPLAIAQATATPTFTAAQAAQRPLSTFPPLSKPTSSAPPEVTATLPTPTPLETFPTEAGLLTPAAGIPPSQTEPQPSPTPTFTPQPTPTTVYGVVVELTCTVTPGTPVNIRRGPSRSERLLGALPAGNTFRAKGRNEDASWLYGTGQNGVTGWMIASGLVCKGDTRDLAIVDR